MNIKKISWWLIVVVLLSVSIFILLSSFDGEKTNKEQLSDFAKSISDNPEQWENIKIGGIYPDYFCKNLYINSNLTIDSLQFSMYLLLILLMFIAATNIYKKSKRKKRKIIEKNKIC